MEDADAKTLSKTATKAGNGTTTTTLGRQHRDAQLQLSAAFLPSRIASAHVGVLAQYVVRGLAAITASCLSHDQQTAQQFLSSELGALSSELTNYCNYSASFERQLRTDSAGELLVH